MAYFKCPWAGKKEYPSWNDLTNTRWPQTLTSANHFTENNNLVPFLNKKNPKKVTLLQFLCLAGRPKLIRLWKVSFRAMNTLYILDMASLYCEDGSCCTLSQKIWILYNLLGPSHVHYRNIMDWSTSPHKYYANWLVETKIGIEFKLKIGSWMNTY